MEQHKKTQSEIEAQIKKADDRAYLMFKILFLALIPLMFCSAIFSMGVAFGWWG